MNCLELIQITQKISQDSTLVFSSGDEILSNRFDVTNNNRYQPEDKKTKLSYCLFSYITNAIIFKAQGKTKEGYSLFDVQLEKIIEKEKDIEFLGNLKEIKDNAMRMLSSFFENKKEIRLPILMEKLIPLCILRCAYGEGKRKSKKFYREYKKNKEVIFNQATLFCRSFYRSFLSKKEIEPKEIQSDSSDLSNGIFIYAEKEVLIPTYQNAFTLDSYKMAIRHGILTFSPDLNISKIDKFSVLYIVKDIICSYSF